MLSSSNEENKKESYIRLPQNQMAMAQSNERPSSDREYPVRCLLQIQTFLLNNVQWNTDYLQKWYLPKIKSVKVILLETSE